MNKNVIEINDTEINLDLVNPVPTKGKIQMGDLEPIPQTSQIQSPINSFPKFDQLVEKAKSPLQLKREEISREAPEARRLRLLILNRYKLSERFGQHLEQLGFKLDLSTLNNHTIPELDSIINDIRFCISTKNVHSFWQDATTQGVGIIERVISPWYNVTGLSQVLSSDETYKDVCEELILEHQKYLYCKPEYRLAYSVLKTATSIHAQHEFFKTSEGKKQIEQYKKSNNISIEEEIKVDKVEQSQNLNIAPKDIKNIEKKYEDLI